MPKILQRIGIKSNELTACIVITVISEQIYDTVALAIKSHHIKMIAFINQTSRQIGSNQTVGIGREASIFKGINKVWLTHIYIVAQLYGTRITGAIYLIRHFSVKIAIVAQKISSHLDTSIRIYRRNQHRVGCQLLENPMSEAFLITLKPIIYPQSEGYRETHVRVYKDSVVWSYAYGSIHLFECVLCCGTLIFIYNVYLLQSQIKSLPFGQMLGCRTCCQHDDRQYSHRPSISLI